MSGNDVLLAPTLPSHWQTRVALPADAFNALFGGTCLRDRSATSIEWLAVPQNPNVFVAEQSNVTSA
jgi:hypothetical protein